MQAIRTATSGAAAGLKLEGFGRLAPGSPADFVVLGRDPLADIRHTRTIASVWIAGNQVPPK
jgi:imidazolonepropionase-like amidohydrolase